MFRDCYRAMLVPEEGKKEEEEEQKLCNVERKKRGKDVGIKGWTVSTNMFYPLPLRKSASESFSSTP